MQAGIPTDDQFAALRVWEWGGLAGFYFQAYHRGVTQDPPVQEALAILIGPEGKKIPNGDFFDRLREMPDEWQIAVDRYLIPQAISAALDEGRLPVAVNLHLSTLTDPAFPEFVAAIFGNLGLTRDDVFFEVVEPHVPDTAQLTALKAISSRLDPEHGLTLIVDDHDFATGEERLRRLAPFCEMVKIDHEAARAHLPGLRKRHPDLSIIIERVDSAMRAAVLAEFQGVAVQGPSVP
jgi:EAL domain-containing protein (putative c-di-GMP-specific phosphodiesterase class I)